MSHTTAELSARGFLRPSLESIWHVNNVTVYHEVPRYGRFSRSIGARHTVTFDYGGSQASPSRFDPVVLDLEVTHHGWQGDVTAAENTEAFAPFTIPARCWDDVLTLVERDGIPFHLAALAMKEKS